MGDIERQCDKLSTKTLKTKFAKRCREGLSLDEAVRKVLRDFRAQRKVVLQGLTRQLNPIREPYDPVAEFIRNGVLSFIGSDCERLAVVSVTVELHHVRLAILEESHVPTLATLRHPHLSPEPIFIANNLT